MNQRSKKNRENRKDLLFPKKTKKIYFEKSIKNLHAYMLLFIGKNSLFITHPENKQSEVGKLQNFYFKEYI